MEIINNIKELIEEYSSEIEDYDNYIKIAKTSNNADMHIHSEINKQSLLGIQKDLKELLNKYENRTNHLEINIDILAEYDFHNESIGELLKKGLLFFCKGNIEVFLEQVKEKTHYRVAPIKISSKDLFYLNMEVATTNLSSHHDTSLPLIGVRTFTDISFLSDFKNRKKYITRTMIEHLNSLKSTIILDLENKKYKEVEITISSDPLFDKIKSKINDKNFRLELEKIVQKSDEESNMGKLQIGDEIVMYINYKGITSEEDTKVVAINNDTIELERDSESNWVFSRESGACLNDNTFMGVKRYISAKQLAKQLNK